MLLQRAITMAIVVRMEPPVNVILIIMAQIDGCSQATNVAALVQIFKLTKIPIVYIANDRGNRTTPSFDAFTDNERPVGGAAVAEEASKPTVATEAETAAKVAKE